MSNVRGHSLSALRPLQFALGVCTLWPLARFVYDNYDMLVSGGDPANPFREWRPTTLLDFSSLALYLALLVFFLIYTYRSARVPTDKRAAWTFFLLFAGFVAMPLFWFMYIWRPVPAQEANAP